MSAPNAKYSSFGVSEMGLTEIKIGVDIVVADFDIRQRRITQVIMKKIHSPPRTMRLVCHPLSPRIQYVLEQ